MVKQKSKFDLFQGQVQTYVGFTAFMTAVVVFFLGFILSSFNQFHEAIRVPTALLTISMFGFLYATLVYSNAAQKVSDEQEKAFRKHLVLGDTISEYLGVYPLVVSIPLVISVVSSDPLLRGVGIIAALGGLVIYQFSSVSIIEYQFKKEAKPLAILTTLLSVCLIITQLTQFYFFATGILFIIFLIFLALLSRRQPSSER